jgi:hypothetical protein
MGVSFGKNNLGDSDGSDEEDSDEGEPVRKKSKSSIEDTTKKAASKTKREK